MPRETVWKIAEGFLIAFDWWLKGTKWDTFALFWPLATRQIGAYSNFQTVSLDTWVNKGKKKKGRRPEMRIPGLPFFMRSSYASSVPRRG